MKAVYNTGDIILKRLADNTNPDSFSVSLRRKRFTLFLDMINTSEGTSLEILDVGGTVGFWESMQFLPTVHHLTILNPEITPQKIGTVKCVRGDARNMSMYKDNTFDIVFSNSVIEHVGSLEDQKAMANEIRRVGRKYFIQTPGYCFFIEPHFLLPFFHWLPMKLRIWLVYKFHPGWYGKNIISWNDAKKVVNSVRLLRKSELSALFPCAVIKKEKILGLTKSYIVTKTT